ncbi:CAP domain-containing protein [Dietzia maris]|uniref:CAP domain-containing protein n=1 Tax=Dietzia maris TaxID=37915 RepID=A0AAE4R077_9ACTN|nr:CAP domain-containing protein [Dietzia maris]MDV6299919.1 CAP domain-containing protein [Dietzia maris]
MSSRTAARAAAASLILVGWTVVSGCAELDTAVNGQLSSVAPEGRTAVEPPADPSPVEAETNVQRSENGLPPLDASERLRDSACAKADDMIARGYWGHTAPDGSGGPSTFIRQAGVDYSRAAENLFYSSTGGPDPVANWMQSPGHRENILDPDLTRVGVCLRTAAYQGLPEAYLYVQHFATPMSER